MNDCEKEQAIFEALIRGRLDGALQEHVKVCSVCSDIVAVAAFNIIATLIMVVMEKRTEIGILKSFGMNARSVRLIFLYQGGLVGLVGTAIGCALGYLGCWAQATFEVIRLPAEIYFISALPVDPRWGDFTLVALAAVGLCLLAAVYPAARAARLFPVSALQYGG